MKRVAEALGTGQTARTNGNNGWRKTTDFGRALLIWIKTPSSSSKALVLPLLFTIAPPTP